MTLSLSIVLFFMFSGLGFLIYFSSIKNSPVRGSVNKEKAAPLIFTAPLLSWLVYVKYNDIEASYFTLYPYAGTALLIVALLLVFVNLKKQ